MATSRKSVYIQEACYLTVSGPKEKSSVSLDVDKVVMSVRPHNPGHSFIFMPIAA